jgi:hypothetical protein
VVQHVEEVVVRGEGELERRRVEEGGAQGAEREPGAGQVEVLELDGVKGSSSERTSILSLVALEA